MTLIWWLDQLTLNLGNKKNFDFDNLFLTTNKMNSSIFVQRWYSNGGWWRGNQGHTIAKNEINIINQHD
jgi:hypothetical protein